MPACAVTSIDSSSSSSTRFIRRRSISTPPSAGIAPPTTLDPAPYGVTGTPLA
jgi:hypothetical protein